MSAMASWCVFLPRSSSDDVNECLVIFSREFAEIAFAAKKRVTAKFLDLCREVDYENVSFELAWGLEARACRRLQSPTVRG